MTNTSPVSIVANRHVSILGIYRRIYSSILYGGGYRSSTLVPPDGVTKVLMDAISFKKPSCKSEKSARNWNQFSIINRKTLEARVEQPIYVMNDKNTAYKHNK